MASIHTAGQQPMQVYLLDPTLYNRQFEHDIQRPEKPETLQGQGKRVALVALPFFNLCSSLTQPIAFVASGLRVYSSLSTLIEGYKSGNSWQMASGMVNTAISVASLAASIFAPAYNLLITTGHDLALNASNLIHALNKQDLKEAGVAFAEIVANAFYIGLFFTASLQLSVLATSVQVLIGLYRSADDFQKGNYLEAGGNMLMSAIRTHQLVPRIQMWNVDNWLPREAG